MLEIVLLKDRRDITGFRQLQETPIRRDIPVGVPLDLSKMEWHELPKYNGIPC